MTPSGCCNQQEFFRLQLLSGEDESLLIRGNAFLVLNLGLDVFDSVGRLHVEGDGLAGECLYEDLHAFLSYEEMEGRLAFQSDFEIRI